MNNLLIAGGSAPYLVDLAKMLKQSGCRVVFADEPQSFYQGLSAAQAVLLTDTLRNPSMLDECLKMVNTNAPELMVNVFGALTPSASIEIQGILQRSSVRYIMMNACPPNQLAGLLQSSCQPVRRTSAPSVMPNAAPKFQSMMIAVHSPKGGVGKTSLAIELSETIAMQAAQANLPVGVCLVDMNPSFDTMASSLNCVRSLGNYPCLTDWVDVIEKKTFASMTPEEIARMEADEQHSFTPFLKEDQIQFTQQEVFSMLVKDQQTGLWILPTVALPLDVKYVQPAYIRIVLNTLKKYFSYLIVDTGNNIGFFTMESLQAADEIFLVTAPTTGSVTVMQKLIANIDRLGIDFRKLNLIVNSPNGRHANIVPEEASSYLRVSLVGVIPYDEGVRESHEGGTPYIANKPSSTYSMAMNALAAKVCPALAQNGMRPNPGSMMPAQMPAPAPKPTGPIPSASPEPEKKKGFFARMFG